jgi:hypothetical protein
LSLPNNETTFDEQWVVPLTMTNRAENNFTHLAPDAWLTESTMIIEDVATTDDWLIVNLQQIGEKNRKISIKIIKCLTCFWTGFFRVNYDEENWRKLASYLNSMDNFGKIHVNNRAQLINDALSLARANFVSYPAALDFTNYLAYETEYLPWATAFSSLEYINDRLVSEEDSLNTFEVSGTIFIYFYQICHVFITKIRLVKGANLKTYFSKVL